MKILLPTIYAKYTFTCAKNKQWLLCSRAIVVFTIPALPFHQRNERLCWANRYLLKTTFPSLPYSDRVLTPAKNHIVSVTSGSYFYNKRIESFKKKKIVCSILEPS